MGNRSILVAVLLLAGPAAAQEPIPEPIEMGDWIVIGPLPRWGRRPFAPSSAFQRHILEDPAPLPEEGDAIPWPGSDDLVWARLGDENRDALGDGYAHTLVHSPEAARAILEGKGTSMAWINGDPVTGDVYGMGRLRVPVLLRKGENPVFARAVRGGLQLRLVPPESEVEFNQRDVTLPDHRRGEVLDAWGAIPVLNTLDRWIPGAVIEAGGDRHFERTVTPLPPLSPLGVHKVPFRILCRGERHSLPDAQGLPLPVTVRWDGGSTTTYLDVPIRSADEVFTVTYTSEVDGSVQHYAVRPPTRVQKGWPYALILSLHGAGVGARGQAGSYAAKDWAYVVAPTNRRPFGFDWEDWGRLDALDVMADALRRFPIDPDRVILTGHSMGGHGAWHLGVTHPDLWAAVAPSAGWISFWSYAGGGVRSDGEGAEALLWRATSTSDTLSLLENLKGIPVFIIHGEKDDNVPPGQAREMARRLREFHDDFVYREFPGKGHWWGLEETPYPDCVDLQEMWDRLFLRRRDRFAESVSFRTMDVNVSSRRGFVEVLSQVRWHLLSRVDARIIRDERALEITTENVAAIRLHLWRLMLPGEVEIRIDGQVVEAGWDDLSLVRSPEGNWSPGPPPGGERAKGPGRTGPFKKVFGNRFVLIVGTGGSDAERRAALRRARLEAQTWWYRANGRADIIRDIDLDPEAYAGRNWIFVGHAGMNRALGDLAEAVPVRPDAGGVVVGERRLEGEGIACFAVTAHPEDPDTLLGVIGGTDAVGITLSGSTRIIASGIGYPDFCVWTTEDGEKEFGGILAAGFLDTEWKVGSGSLFFADDTEED